MRRDAGIGFETARWEHPLSFGPITCILFKYHFDCIKLFWVLRKIVRICKVLILQDAPVAQSDRAFDYESKGRTFESCRAHHQAIFIL